MSGLQRTTDYTNPSEMGRIDADVGALIDEYNRGLDPTTLPEGKLTANKFAHATRQLTSVQLGTGSIAANSQALVILTFNALTSGLAGTTYDITQYVDYFVDPANTTNLYANSVYPLAGNLKLIPFAYIRNNTASVGTTEFLDAVVGVWNMDTVAHTYYAATTLNVIATQAMGQFS